MKIHIFHHFDADGFCSAAVLTKFLLDHRISENCIEYYVCDHDTTMNLSNVKSKDFVFIVDYSFPMSDRQNIIDLYNNVTNKIYWIDHHATSNKFINDSEVFINIANNGLLETSNKYAGCLLTYFWCTKHRIFNSENILKNEKYVILKIDNDVNNLDELLKHDPDQIYDLAPLWVRLVSDHDTFNHKIPGSRQFCKGLSYQGLYHSFLDPESDFSITFTNDKNCLHKMIETIITIGDIILESEGRTNKKLIKNNSFTKEFIIKNNDGDEKFSVICFNGYGNSDVFGDEYYTHDAVCVFYFNGINYRYSMFAKKDSKINCSTIALWYNQLYKLNGGGHQFAAGWSAPINIFENSGDTIIITNDVNS